MVYTNHHDVAENMSAGDKVYAVRKNAYAEQPVEKWPEVKPIHGTLQSSYTHHPIKGPRPPRHFMPDIQDPEHSWEGPWWDMNHWIICTTEAEAKAELEKQKRAYIAKAEHEIAQMRALLLDE